MISVPQADAFARRVHGCDRTKAGIPLIEHVRRVARRVKGDPDPYAVVAALLHDTVEKGSCEWSELRAAGADDRLVTVVDALTQRDAEPERVYLARCAADSLALRIKRADLADKLDGQLGGALGVAAAADLRARARRRLDLLEHLAHPAAHHAG